MQALVGPNRAEAEAVDARQELDLKASRRRCCGCQPPCPPRCPPACLPLLGDGWARKRCGAAEATAPWRRRSAPSARHQHSIAACPPTPHPTTHTPPPHPLAGGRRLHPLPVPLPAGQVRQPGLGGGVLRPLPGQQPRQLSACCMHLAVGEGARRGHLDAALVPRGPCQVRGQRQQHVLDTRGAARRRLGGARGSSPARAARNLASSNPPPQTPTLTFCVERHQAIAAFQPEPFWVVRPRAAKAGLSLNVRPGAAVLGAGWGRGRSAARRTGGVIYWRQLECWRAAWPAHSAVQTHSHRAAAPCHHPVHPCAAGVGAGARV